MRRWAALPCEVVSPRSPAGSGGLLGAFSICVVSSNWCGVIFLKSQKYSEIMVLECNEGKVQFRKIAFAEGRGWRKEEFKVLLSSTSLCSLSYSASRSWICPNVFTTNYIQEKTCPLFWKVIFPNNVVCLCLQTPLAGSLEQLTASAGQSWSKENHRKTKKFFFFCPFLSIQVVSRGFPGSLRYMINSPGFLLASSVLAYWEYLNY